jgi:hypothetical protein
MDLPGVALSLNLHILAGRSLEAARIAGPLIEDKP